MMKILLAVLCVALTGVSSLCGADFSKGDKIELIGNPPIYFKDAVLRIGKDGEQFTVLLHNANTHRVFLSAQDALGKEIAVNVSDSALRKAGLAPALKPAMALKEAKPEEAVFLVSTKAARGTAFLAKLNGACYVVTNAHVAAGGLQLEFKNSATKFTITSGQVDVANDRDLVRFPSDKDFSLMLSGDVKADDPAVAYGNSGGESVITKLDGKILGIGVERVEVSCEFIPGNSGGPILDGQGRVFAVASFITRNTKVADWIKNGTRFETARRFGLRVTDDIKWTRVPFTQFVSESSQIDLAWELSDYFGEVLNQLLFGTFAKPIENKFPKNGDLANFVTTYNRAVATLSSKDGAFATDAETRKSNVKLRGTARQLTGEFVRIINATATDLRLNMQRIQTPYYKKIRDDILSEIADESRFVNDNAKEAFGSDFLK